MRLRLEMLEERRLLTGTPTLLKDINDLSAGAGSSNPQEFVEVGSIAFFSAEDGHNGRELWISNGTAAGTYMVRDILPGSGSSNPHGLTNVNGKLYFAASDGIDGAGNELWISDGTLGGTQLVRDIAPTGNFSSNPVNLTNVNNTLFFSGHDNDINHPGQQLWKSDGTFGGTQLVALLGTQSPSHLTDPSNFTAVGGTLFFTTDADGSGMEVWKSNGTGGGTARVADINSGAAASNPQSLVNVGGTLFFSANNGSLGTELWKSNGTEPGTELVEDVRPGSDSSNPTLLTDVGGTLFFSANNGSLGNELWKTNGTTTGLVADVLPGASGSNPTQLTNVDGVLFFAAASPASNTNLWRSDGTAGGTFRLNLPTNDIRPLELTNVAGQLFFQAGDAAHATELWMSNGTPIGTVLVKDINPTIGSLPNSLANINGKLFFSANDGTHGSEPWTSQIPSFVADYELFYKGSSRFNVTNNNLPDFSDDNAIAHDKTAYLPGSGAATFTSVSSYTRGINGIMIDLAGLHGALTANDFTFKVGNNNSPNSWAAAPAPTTVSTRAGAGTASTDRIELMWANIAVQKQWLEVIVEGNDAAGGFNTNTGLASSYVFYYGSAPGDSGAGDAQTFVVNSTDEQSARNDPHSLLSNPATIANSNDYNRDGAVNTTDQQTSRNNPTAALTTALKFISIGLGGPFAPIVTVNSVEPTAGSDDFHASTTRSIELRSESNEGDRGIASTLASLVQELTWKPIQVSDADARGLGGVNAPTGNPSTTVTAIRLDLVTQPDMERSRLKDLDVENDPVELLAILH